MNSCTSTDSNLLSSTSKHNSTHYSSESLPSSSSKIQPDSPHSQVSSNASTSAVGTSEPAICLKDMPSPHPGRKSVLSFKVPPVSNRLCQRKTVVPHEVKPVPVLKRSVNDREEFSSRDGFKVPKLGSKEMSLNRMENVEPNFCGLGAEKKPKFIWEKTFMEVNDEKSEKEEDANNCKTQ